ncbi:MAG: hypothetical protein H0T46_20365 [Deltaproteobacteria bacterium]|nr:hypothetical protein [Deltaproteobacteria bacterium]
MTKLPALVLVSSLALGCSHAAPPAPAPPPPDAATTAAPLQDPERCKRPTRAYPRWCDEVVRERVKVKEAEGAKGDPQ